MNLKSIAMLALSADEGWPELARNRPRIRSLFGFLVLPLSLLPPAMLYAAGTHQSGAFAPALHAGDWAAVAAVLFVAEMATFVLMAWLIRQVAATYSLAIDRHDAFVLAAIAPVPLWLAPLGWSIPDLPLNAAIALAALATTCALLYHGVQALGRRRDEIVAAAIVHIVIGGSLAAWAVVYVLAFA